MQGLESDVNELLERGGDWLVGDGVELGEAVEDDLGLLPRADAEEGLQEAELLVGLVLKQTKI